MTNRTVTIDRSSCNGCGECVDVCPTGALRLQDGIATIEQALCSACLACVPVCEPQAIVVTEMVALAPQPEVRVQPAGARGRTTGATIGTLGGAVFAYVAGRFLPALLERLTQEKSPASRTAQSGASETPAPAGSRAGGRRRRRRGN